MIISASRRTDIPACYAPWFARRMAEGFVLIRHPAEQHLLTRVPLTPDVVDGVVFWTKHFAPMLPYLDVLHDIPYYVQYTLTPYGSELEPGLPDIWHERIPAFAQLARQIGAQRIIWRYDPVVLTKKYTVAWHITQFERMAAMLAPLCRHCVFSFLDMYQSTVENMAGYGLQRISQHDMRVLAQAFAEIAAAHGMPLVTCCEAIDLSRFAIAHGACVDAAIFEELSGIPLHLPAYRGTRIGCRCVKSTDIGAYGTCTNGCRYCYANADASSALRQHALHNPASPLLTGTSGPADVIRPMKAESYREMQLRMF